MRVWKRQLETPRGPHHLPWLVQAVCRGVIVVHNTCVQISLSLDKKLSHWSMMMTQTLHLYHHQGLQRTPTLSPWHLALRNSLWLTDGIMDAILGPWKNYPASSFITPNHFLQISGDQRYWVHLSSRSRVSRRGQIFLAERLGLKETPWQSLTCPVANCSSSQCTLDHKWASFTVHYLQSDDLRGWGGGEKTLLNTKISHKIFLCI